MHFYGLICFQYEGLPCCPQATTRSKTSIKIQGFLSNLKLFVFLLKSTTMEFVLSLAFNITDSHNDLRQQ